MSAAPKLDVTYGELIFRHPQTQLITMVMCNRCKGGDTRLEVQFDGSVIPFCKCGNNLGMFQDSHGLIAVPEPRLLDREYAKQIAFEVIENLKQPNVDCQTLGTAHRLVHYLDDGELRTEVIAALRPIWRKTDRVRAFKYAGFVIFGTALGTAVRWILELVP